ncbi:hypothetical protein [Pleionea sediminis]|uniref:hypothetical protein n=1 Tax=Pleionea sediminis TaxID=2569479 RepID=UPI0011854345|nr:hypothetical protein [Pleionea sediminis]
MTELVLDNFRFILLALMALAIFVNRRLTSLLLLSLIIFLSHVVYFVMFDYIWDWGNAKVTWNLWWVALEFPVFTVIYLKFNSRYSCDEDLQILYLSLAYMLFNFIQAIDWNYFDGGTMAKIMTYSMPTINLLTVMVLFKRFIFERFDRLASFVKRSKAV